MRNERKGKRNEIEKAVEIIQTASENLEKSICLLQGVIGQMDAAEDYAKFQREQFCVVEREVETVLPLEQRSLRQKEG